MSNDIKTISRDEFRAKAHMISKDMIERAVKENATFACMALTMITAEITAELELSIFGKPER